MQRGVYTQYFWKLRCLRKCSVGLNTYLGEFFFFRQEFCSCCPGCIWGNSSFTSKPISSDLRLLWSQICYLIGQVVQVNIKCLQRADTGLAPALSYGHKTVQVAPAQGLASWWLLRFRSIPTFHCNCWVNGLTLALIKDVSLKVLILSIPKSPINNPTASVLER